MLELNKKTVSHLSNQEMQKVNGGICIKSTKKTCKWELSVDINIDIKIPSLTQVEQLEALPADFAPVSAGSLTGASLI